jgi:hypothetical protein
MSKFTEQTQTKKPMAQRTAHMTYRSFSCSRCSANAAFSSAVNLIFLAVVGACGRCASVNRTDVSLGLKKDWTYARRPGRPRCRGEFLQRALDHIAIGALFRGGGRRLRGMFAESINKYGQLSLFRHIILN